MLISSFLKIQPSHWCSKHNFKIYKHRDVLTLQKSLSVRGHLQIYDIGDLLLLNVYKCESQGGKREGVKGRRELSEIDTRAVGG